MGKDVPKRRSPFDRNTIFSGRQLPGNQPTDTSGGSPPRTGPRSNANRVSLRRRANRNRDLTQFVAVSPGPGRADSPHTPRPSSSPINRRRSQTSPQWDENGNVIDSEEEPDDDVPEEEPDPDDPCRDVRRERDNALAEITRLQAERNDLTLRNVALRAENDRLEYSRMMRGQTIRRLRNERDALRGALPRPVPRPPPIVAAGPPEQNVPVDHQTPPGQTSYTQST
ncbi:hypothetical protein Q7P36_007824 [Cladosporium allicinum]